MKVSRTKYRALTATVAVFVVLLNGVKLQDIVARAFGYHGSVPMFALDKMVFGYSAERAYGVIAAYGEAGRRAYAFLLLTVDLIFPFLYGYFLFLSLQAVSLRAGFSTRWAGRIAAIGFVAAACDWMENISFLILMRIFPGQSITVTKIGSFFTMTKFLLSGVSVLTLVVTGIWVLWNNSAANSQNAEA
jgi:hypothetical protein